MHMSNITKDKYSAGKGNGKKVYLSTSKCTGPGDNIFFRKRREMLGAGRSGRNPDQDP